MNPDNMKEYNELLWLMVKKNKRTSVRGQRSTRYIDPGHVCFIQLTTPPWDLESTEVMQYESYCGDDERIFKVPDLNCPEAQTMHCPTDYLKKIVDNIRSSDVKITVSDAFPIKLEWKDGEDEWCAVIAPRIENERARYLISTGQLSIFAESS